MPLLDFMLLGRKEHRQAPSNPSPLMRKGDFLTEFSGNPRPSSTLDPGAWRIQASGGGGGSELGGEEMWGGQALEPWASISFTCDSKCITTCKHTFAFSELVRPKLLQEKVSKSPISPSVISPGEGNGKPFQHSCLENIVNK